MFRFALTGFAAATVVFGALSAEAAFTAPSWRPADDTQASAESTTYQGWDVFTSPGGPNTADVGEVNPNGDAAAHDPTPGSSFVTSGGNIYSADGALDIVVELPNFGLGSGYTTEFVVQIRMQGSELDTTSVTLDGTDVSTLAGYSYTEASRTALGGFGGSLVDHFYSFSVTGNAASYSLGWLAVEAHASQDAIAIDTRAVTTPEPTSLLLLSSGLAVVALRRRDA